jgi:beta-carotene ketolase (CrtW type)
MNAAAAPAHRGLAIGLGIIAAWAVCLAVQLSLPWPPEGLPAWLPLGFAVQTFLFTGLFITAHDAMHGTLSPAHPRLNHALGWLCVTLYAGFDYGRMRVNHMRHHAHPGEPGDDPDFHDGRRTGPVAWYLGFMARYMSWRPLLIQAALFQVLTTGLGLPWQQALLCQAVPAIASSVQLFWFGTYLTHRVPAGGHTNRHNARSSGWPTWLSLLTCYHFGYHEEHHEVPGAAWWQLPAVRRTALARATAGRQGATQSSR